MMKKKHPLLSIIVPIYNGQKYIQRCIEGIEKNEDIELEIIIINDGSIDSSLEEINKILSKYNNIIFFNNSKNYGVSYSRNLGIKYATGDYIGFVDVDDEIEHNMFTKLVGCAIENQSDVVVCNYIEISENKKNIVNSKYKYKHTSLDQYNSLKNYLIDYISPAVWDKIYKKDIIKKIKFDEQFSIGEDILFCLEVFLNSTKVTFINESLYKYNQNNNSTMHNLSHFLFDFKKILFSIPYNYEETLNKDYLEEYQYFKYEMITRGIHSISSMSNNKNKKIISDFLKVYYDRKIFREICRNKYFSKKIKLEIFILKNFGINVHIFLIPIYKKFRNLTRMVH